MNLEDQSSERIIGAAIEVHRHLGPGLIESLYEDALCRELSLSGIPFVRQMPVPVIYKGEPLSVPLRLDLLVEDLVILDLKAKEEIAPVDRAKLLTYLRLTNKRLGLLINFHVPILKHGIFRVVNNLPEPPPSLH